MFQRQGLKLNRVVAGTHVGLWGAELASTILFLVHPAQATVLRHRMPRHLWLHDGRKLKLRTATSLKESAWCCVLGGIWERHGGAGAFVCAFFSSWRIPRTLQFRVVVVAVEWCVISDLAATL